MLRILALLLALAPPALAQELSREQQKLLRPAEKLQRKVDRATTRGQWGDALVLARQMLDARADVLGPDHPALLETLDLVLYLEGSLGEFEAALLHGQRAVAIREAQAAPNGRDLAITVFRVGQARARVGDIEQAVGELDRAINLFAEAGVADDWVAASAHMELGTLAFDAGLPEVARYHHGRVVEIYESPGSADPLETALASYQLGQIEVGTGNPGAAIPHLQRAADLLTATVGAGDNMTRSAKSALSEAMTAAGDARGAAVLAKASLDETILALGPDAGETGEAWLVLGLAQLEVEQYGLAVNAFAESRRIFAEVLGPEHAKVAYLMVEQATALSLSGNPGAAAMLNQQALPIYEASFGPSHPNTLYTMGQVVSDLQQIGQLSAALELARERHGRLVEAGGEGSPEAALALLDLAGLYVDMADVSRGVEASQQAIAQLEGAWGAHDKRLAVPLSVAGDVALEAGDHATAMALTSRALRILERESGPSAVETAITRTSMAQILLLMGRSDLALSMSEQALDDLTATGGEDSPLRLMALQVAGAASQRQGDMRTARIRLEAAAKLSERALGPSHPKTAVALNNYAQLLSELGDREGAVLRFRQAIDIQHALGLDHHPDTGRMFMNQAAAGSASLDELSIELYGLAMQTFEAAYGTREHPEIGLVLRGIADVHQMHGRPSMAIEQYAAALAILEATLSDSHPEMSTTLNNLATAHATAGDYDAAIPLFRRVLDTRELDAAKRTTTLTSLARVLSIQGQEDEARALAKEAIDHHHQQLQALLDLASERERRAFITERRPALDTWLMVTNRPEDAADRYDELLSWKGLVAVSSLTERRARAQSDDPEVQRRLDELASIRSALARLTLSGRGGEDDRASAVWLVERKEELERELSGLARSRGAQLDAMSVKPAQICQSLPKGTVLVDLFAHDAPGELISTDRVLSAFVLTGGDCDRVQEVSLGSTNLLAERSKRWRRTLSATGVPTAAIDKAGAAVAEQVWTPLQPLVGDADTVLIVPDAYTVGLPWAGLPVGDGRYLLEDVRLAYLESAQQLLTLKGSTPTARGAALVVGGVDYGGDTEAPTLSTRGGNTCSLSAFAPLPATADEARAILATLDGHVPVTSLTGAGATEAALREAVAGKSVVHIATHGFFVGGDAADCGEAANHAGAMNPMATSGLALTGVNTGGADGTDGLWTAEEMSDLDLDGTELVVLSACETALGQAGGSEGVLGLRRALSVAGVQTSVMSLWPVDDDPTRQLMEAMYGHLYADDPLGAADALRQAQLDLLERARQEQGEAMPRWWAAFVSSGEWR